MSSNEDVERVIESEEFHDEDHYSNYYDSNQIAALRKEFQEFLNQVGVNEDVQTRFWHWCEIDNYHDHHFNVVQQILESNFEYFEDKAKSDEDHLLLTGFSPTSSIFNFVSKQNDSSHLTLRHHLDTFLELVFLSDRPISNGEFPYQDSCRNEDFTHEDFAPKDTASHHECSSLDVLPSGRRIVFKNVDQVSSLRQALLEEEEEASQKNSDGFVSAYHGTTASNALNIVESKINIYHGQRYHDFSDRPGGFYVSSQISSAVTRAKSRLQYLETPGLERKSDFPETGAVLVFRIPVKTLESKKEVDGLITDFSSNLEAWADIVRYFRSGVFPQRSNPRPASLPENPHFIRGPVPISFNPPTPHPILSQICVKSKQFSALMDDFIEKIIFFKKTAIPEPEVEGGYSKTSVSGCDGFNLETLSNVLVEESS